MDQLLGHQDPRDRNEAKERCVWEDMILFDRFLDFLSLLRQVVSHEVPTRNFDFPTSPGDENKLQTDSSGDI